MSSIAVPEGFISLEWELPVNGGWYELFAAVLRGGKICREIVSGYFNAERDCFESVPGVLYATHFRDELPDVADLEEFHKREEMGVIWI